MIPWHESSWSTNDALASVGLRHADGCIKRGSRVVFGESTGHLPSNMRTSCFEANAWLAATEQVWRWEAAR